MVLSVCLYNMFSLFMEFNLTIEILYKTKYKTPSPFYFSTKIEIILLYALFCWKMTTNIFEFLQVKRTDFVQYIYSFFHFSVTVYVCVRLWD